MGRFGSRWPQTSCVDLVTRGPFLGSLREPDRVQPNGCYQQPEREA